MIEVISLERIRYFLSVAESGSFTKASQECFVTQTAISQQIALLEKELEVKLFQRDNKSVRLTEAGHRLLPMAQRIWADYQEMLLVMQRASYSSSQILIGYSGNAEIQMLREMMHLAKKQLPSIQIQARKYPLDCLPEAFAEGKCTIALTITDDISPQMCYSDRIIAGRMMVAVSDKSALASRESLLLEETLRYPMIILNPSPGAKSSSFYYQWVRNKGFAEKSIIKVSSIEEQMFLVSADQGIAFMPEEIVAPGIRLIPLSDTPTTYSISAYYRQKTPQIMQCIRLMKEIAERLYPGL